MTVLKAFKVQGVEHEAWNLTEAVTTTRTLAASTAESQTIVAGAAVMLIADQDCWFNLVTTATVPTDDASKNRFLPAGVERWFWSSDLTTFSIISASVAHVEVNYWAP